MPSFLEKLLSYYGLTDDDYKRLNDTPSFADLPIIKEDPNVKLALARLEQARLKSEPVLIYGDYDTDGVSSASILFRAFHDFGLAVSAYLPSRYLDGYGVNASNVERIAKKGFKLLVTCDNGVTAHEALQKARELGMETIVIDHHEFDGTEPECTALVHADRLGLSEPISAGLLSYFFARALLGHDDEYLLTLGALSTLSDAMPLSGVNRLAVRLGLRRLSEQHFPSIALLSDKTSIDERTLQMEVIPKINAVGRLLQGTEINRLLNYFAFPEKADLPGISSWLKDINGQRKELTKQAEALLSIDPTEEAIVVRTETPEGLNGLLASRLLEEYGKPVCVFSPALKEPHLLVGSIRSEEGFNVLKALQATKVPLVSKGGHSFAGGVAIKDEDFNLFKKDFLYSALKHKIEKKEQPLIPLLLSECTMENYRLIVSFGPFGNGHEAPLFLLERLDPTTFQYLKDGKYLSTNLLPGIRLFSFSISSSSFDSPDPVALQVAFSLHEWNGRQSLDLLAEKHS
jgi:Single-stranded DNA-specific exonuclease